MGTVEGALLVIDPRSVRHRLKFWAWGVAVELDDEFDDEPRSTRYLIERQRKLGESPRPIDRLRAAVFGSALSHRLNGLSDRQIGQLLFDFCWAECSSPQRWKCLHSCLAPNKKRKKTHSNSIASRISRARRTRQRLPSSLLIENASEQLFSLSATS